MTKIEVFQPKHHEDEVISKSLFESSIGYYDAHLLLKFENDCGRNNKVEMNFSFFGEWLK